MFEVGELNCMSRMRTRIQRSLRTISWFKSFGVASIGQLDTVFSQNTIFL